MVRESGAAALALSELSGENEILFFIIKSMRFQCEITPVVVVMDLL